MTVCVAAANDAGMTAPAAGGPSQESGYQRGGRQERHVRFFFADIETISPHGRKDRWQVMGVDDRPDEDAYECVRG